jgi:hypothetical protein
MTAETFGDGAHRAPLQQPCKPTRVCAVIKQAMAETHTGQCHCGAVEIEMRGDPLEVGYCHCENCRRCSAAPVSAFTLWKKESVSVTKGEEFLG